jgi:hypothetical protein
MANAEFKSASAALPGSILAAFGIQLHAASSLARRDGRGKPEACLMKPSCRLLTDSALNWLDGPGCSQVEVAVTPSALCAAECGSTLGDGCRSAGGKQGAQAARRRLTASVSATTQRRPALASKMGEPLYGSGQGTSCRWPHDGSSLSRRPVVERGGQLSERDAGHQDR